jgi:WXG100 family type VII secretion target
MSASKVQIQYDEFDGIIQRIQSQMEAVATMNSQVRQRVETLQNGGWIGRGANSFFSEMQDMLFPGMDRLRQGLENAAATARDVAGRFHTSEQEAANLFRR